MCQKCADYMRGRAISASHLYFDTQGQNNAVEIMDDGRISPRRNNNEGDKNMAEKFYRVKKDTPLVLAGAILRKTDERYYPISDLWDAYEGRSANGTMVAGMVEAPENKDWFERVYEVSVLGKAKFLIKEAAQKAYSDLHKEK